MNRHEFNKRICSLCRTAQNKPGVQNCIHMQQSIHTQRGNGSTIILQKMFHDAYRFHIIRLESLYCSAYIEIIQIQNIILPIFVSSLVTKLLTEIQHLDSLHLSTIYGRTYQMPITGFPRTFQTGCTGQTTPLTLPNTQITLFFNFFTH